MLFPIHHLETPMPDHPNSTSSITSSRPGSQPTPVAQADLVGGDADLRAPASSETVTQRKVASSPSGSLQEPRPAEDENQPGFLGERNRPDAPPSLQGNHGSFSNEAPGLVGASALNDGDTGVASDKPEAGGQLDFDDGDMVDGGRDKPVRMGRDVPQDGAQELRRSLSEADRQGERPD
jgi:hypothetical protein